ncbi:MAG: hypothetical protein CVU88_05660 [Firmicutes bacterium HGW-Firmicutes-13]|nr:MAG: hypothetical protein CVU88_05660 [Firmicutes bacterium HGW-Firmicutes-13]
MGKIDKYLEYLYKYPVPNDVKYESAARFLISIGCKMRKKKGGSHRIFTYTGYTKVITLIENENLKTYHIKQIKELLKFIGIVEEEDDR